MVNELRKSLRSRLNNRKSLSDGPFVFEINGQMCNGEISVRADKALR